MIQLILDSTEILVQVNVQTLKSEGTINVS
jgi:hypothetical protein